MKNVNAFKILILIAIVIVGGIFLWRYSSDSNLGFDIIQNTEPEANIIQDRESEDLITEEGAETIYRGIVYREYKNIFKIVNNEITFEMDTDYNACTSYSVIGKIENVFLRNNEELKNISWAQIKELENTEEVLSVTIIEKKEVSFINDLKDLLMSVAQASCYSSLGTIAYPDKIIFERPIKTQVKAEGSFEGEFSLNFWVFEPKLNQGVHVRKNAYGKLVVEATTPIEYFISFKGSEYIKLPLNNFSQNSTFPDLIDRIMLEGEESCPGAGLPCLIRTETLKVDSNLSLEGDKIFKPVAIEGLIRYVYCEDFSGNRCYFFLDNYSGKEGTPFITDSTQFLNGTIQDIKPGKNVTVRGKIECPNLSDILFQESLPGKSFVDCSFFADFIEF
jgi:hypothetical protein